MTGTKPRTTPELLAPAGDWDAMRAAVANGADAVYFGLGNFNARHRATNFRQDELPEIMRYLHAHNVKGFLTFNTLIFSDELEQAADYVRSVAAAGVDAVIVQDLGLARLIKAMAPSLPVHGSTQMTRPERPSAARAIEPVVPTRSRRSRAWTLSRYAGRAQGEDSSDSNMKT